MIIRGTPRNVNDYIAVNNEMSLTLHVNGFVPSYIDENWIYYKADKEILDFLREKEFFDE